MEARAATGLFGPGCWEQLARPRGKGPYFLRWTEEHEARRDSRLGLKIISRRGGWLLGQWTSPASPPGLPQTRPRLTGPRSSPSPGGEEGEGRQEHRESRAPGISCLTKNGAPCGRAGQSRAGCAAVSPSAALSSQTSRPLLRLTPCQVMGPLLWPPQAGPPRSYHPSFCSSNPSYCDVFSPPSTYPNPHLPPWFEPCSALRLQTQPHLSPLPHPFSCFTCCFILFPAISVSRGFFCYVPKCPEARRFIYSRFLSGNLLLEQFLPFYRWGNRGLEKSRLRP